jgi:hypothetical protein
MGGFGGTGKRYNPTLTLSARNALNHVNYGAPNGVLTSPFLENPRRWPVRAAVLSEVPGRRRVTGEWNYS